MKNVFLLCSCLLTVRTFAQPYPHPVPAYTPSAENLTSREAFQNEKFGLFIHWGIYSLLGDGSG
jgi:alpha-L-fucosidase